MTAAPNKPDHSNFSQSAQLNAEHISLQSETLEVSSQKQVQRKSLVKYQLRSRARGTVTRISILEDAHVSVELKRPRAPAREHFVDLRFADPKPIGIRKVGWKWLWIAIAFTLLAAAAVTFVFAFATPVQQPWAVPTAIVLSTLTLSSYLLCLYFTTESLLFVSVHGRARLISITGGLGTCRAAKQCAVDIVKHVNRVRKQSKQSRQHFLRDEMRDLTRLFEQGVLTDQQYADAKGRVLKSHE
jgi:hypothetical protein